MEQTYNRGDLYYVNIGNRLGANRFGYQPVVIIQNDVGNRFCPTTLIAEISTERRWIRRHPTHCFLQSEYLHGFPSTVMLEHICAVDKRSLAFYIGKLTPSDLNNLNYALAVSVGLVDTLAPKPVICLCPKCAKAFTESGNYISQRISPQKTKGEICNYCNYCLGYDYRLIRKRQFPGNL